MKTIGFVRRLLISSYIVFQLTTALVSDNWKDNRYLVIRNGVGPADGVDLSWHMEKFEAFTFCGCESTSVCLLFDRNIPEENVVPSDDYTYGHQTVLVTKDTDLQIMFDGMYYYSTTEKMKYEDALKFCGEPGFQIPTIVTRNHMLVSNKFHGTLGYHYLGLVRYQNGSLLWSNGISFDETKDSFNPQVHLYYHGADTEDAYFINADHRIHDVSDVSTIKVAVLCQANLDFLPWDE